ncbi:MAG: BsuPI-related putative proteinase inhibitor [Thermofilum sp.]
MRIYLIGFTVILIAFVTGCTLIQFDFREPLYMRIWVVRDLADPPNIVSLIFGVENRSNHPVDLILHGKPAHDFVISTSSGTEIWRWGHEKPVQPLVIHKILNPGDYLRFEAKWDQRDNMGKSVPPGHYIVYGLLRVASDKQLKTPPTRLSVGSRPVLIPQLELPASALQDRWNPYFYWRLGIKLSLKLKLKNVSDQAAHVTLLKRPAYDLVVNTLEGHEVWQWTYRKLVQDVTELQTLAPKEELAFEAEWNLHDNQDNPILPGYYCIRGILNVEPPGKIETEKCLTIGLGLPLRITLEVPKEAQASQSVSLKLKIENTSGKVLNLTVGYAPYDFIVTTPDGTEVWRWSYGKAFPLVAMSLTLQPGEVKEYSETWDQLDNEGYPVSPGTYVVRGFFRGAQLENLFETEQSEPLQLIIKP